MQFAAGAASGLVSGRIVEVFDPFAGQGVDDLPLLGRTIGAEGQQENEQDGDNPYLFHGGKRFGIGFQAGGLLLPSPSDFRSASSARGVRLWQVQER